MRLLQVSAIFLEQEHLHREEIATKLFIRNYIAKKVGSPNNPTGNRVSLKSIKYILALVTSIHILFNQNTLSCRESERWFS